MLLQQARNLAGAAFFYFVSQNIKGVFDTNLSLSAEDMNKEKNKC